MRRILEALDHPGRIFLLCMAAALVLGAWWTFSRGEEFEAEGTLFIRGFEGGGPDRSRRQAFEARQVRQLRSPDLIGAALKIADRDPRHPGRLREVRVRPVPQTFLVEVSVRSTSAAHAERFVNELFRQFLLRHRQSLQVRFGGGAVDVLQQIDDLGGEVARADAALQRMPSKERPAAAAELRSRLDKLKLRRQALLDQVKVALEKAQGESTGSCAVVSFATGTGARIETDHLRHMLWFLAGGLAAAGALIAAVAHLRAWAVRIKDKG